jgi:hypothetical protein
VSYAAAKEASCGVAEVITGRYIGINIRGVVAKNVYGEVMQRIFAVGK